MMQKTTYTLADYSLGECGWQGEKSLNLGRSFQYKDIFINRFFQQKV